jgi:hypothetical protein
MQGVRNCFEMLELEDRGSEAASVTRCAEAFEKAPYLRNPPLRRPKQNMGMARGSNQAVPKQRTLYCSDGERAEG